MTVDFAVYDNKNDEVIGVWDDFDFANEFLLDNEGVEDDWEVFPMIECLTPVK